jgi:hypothetical protein
MQKQINENVVLMSREKFHLTAGFVVSFKSLSIVLFTFIDIRRRSTLHISLLIAVWPKLSTPKTLSKSTLSNSVSFY